MEELDLWSVVTDRYTSCYQLVFMKRKQGTEIKHEVSLWNCRFVI